MFYMDDLPTEMIYSIIKEVNVKKLHNIIKVSKTFQKTVYTNNDILLKMILLENYTKKILYLEETLEKYKSEDNDDLDIYIELYDVYKPFYQDKINKIK